MNAPQEDFAAKLVLIEQEARLLLEDVSSRLARERVEHMLTVAHLLRARLNVASSLILSSQQPNEEQQDFARRLLQIENDARLVLDAVPLGVSRDRLQHIATVAETLRTRVSPSS